MSKAFIWAIVAVVVLALLVALSLVVGGVNINRQVYRSFLSNNRRGGESDRAPLFRRPVDRLRDEHGETDDAADKPTDDGLFWPRRRRRLFGEGF